MPALPPPSAPDLLEQLRASLGSNDAFLWRERLLQERLMRNITALHERILFYVHELIDAGLVQFRHQEIAEALTVGVGTVKDALKRARGVGLLDWRAEYRPGPGGVRRRTANVYQVVMPQRSPEPRPDLRRHSPPASRRPPVLSSMLSSWSPQCDEPGRGPLPGFAERFAAKIEHEKRLRAAGLARRPP